LLAAVVQLYAYMFHAVFISCTHIFILYKYAEAHRR
jgi:hypothetical protein